ncbi:nucleic acid-binding, OB-fold-like protein [Actinidia rufa]|uniref:Nucleic acid-binding, OB-fold-like protein n=1 Tax=Actinidia rufa TaxID=165716 RepID=A0A7J0GIH4_9ERIC|nr:nucleic acid-binding, OB-fold-like protein [Actinidia rufa]
MVVVNLLKGGGTALLRNYGPPPPLLPCNRNRVVRKITMSMCGRKWPLSLSSPFSISLHNRHRHCTTAASASETPSSSSTPTVTTVLGGDDNDKEDTDMAMIKNAANTLDIRVGLILRAWRHEEADTLYVEEVDIGEPQPRLICSGLVNYIPLHHLQDRKVVVLANLKPRNMRGVKSFGMLMAASDASHQNVELLVPPEGSSPGERIWFGSADEKDNLSDAATPNQIQKKKIWELVQPHLKTDTSCIATLGMHFMRTSAGVVVCSSLKNANIS